jgi:hypothetical protein
MYFCIKIIIMKKKLVFIALLMSNSLVFSQSLITDRPDQTESSSTSKGVQIESGMLIESDVYGAGTLLRIAITDNIELRVFNQFDFLSGNNEILTNDLELGTKFQVYQKENSNIEIAFLTHLVLPTGSATIINDKIGVINKLCISHLTDHIIGVGYNIGYNYFGYDVGDLTYSVVFGSSITDKASVYIEPYGEFVNFTNSVSNLNFGLTYLINDNFQLDCSSGIGLNSDMTFVSFGFSWRIGQ